MLFSLVYVSTAAYRMRQPALLQLLEQARTHNRAVGLTGLLLYRDLTFLQLLEGQQDRVESLYASICRDPRHHDVSTVWTRAQEHRQFPDWSMGFTNLDLNPKNVEGYSDVLNQTPDPEQPEAELVRDLLDLVGRRG